MPVSLPTFNPELDLMIERQLDVPPHLVWRAWTEPALLKQWYCPQPWGVSHCEIDLRPGGQFHTVMRSPEGQEFPNHGCYLQLVPNERLVWTDALGPDFRPTTKTILEAMNITILINLEPHGAGTKYTAVAMHSDAAGRKRHDEMGFHDGWNTAIDQLVALMKSK